MTLTFNPNTYANLLAEYQPKVIKTDIENEQAIALAEELAHRQNRTPEESALYELLITLIEKYEDEYYPMGQATPDAMLRHLMEAQNLKQTDLEKVLGDSEVTAEVISGQWKMSQAQAKVLAEFFKVDPGVFAEVGDRTNPS